MRKRHVLGAAWCGLLAFPFVAAPTQAESTSRTAAAGPALATCVAEARSRQARRWVCTPDGLTTVDIKGRTSRDAIAAPSGAGFAGGCDEAVCHRRISSYVDETWGGVAFGHGREVIGRFEVVLRTNLGGLGSQWRTTVVPRSGPAITLDGTATVCRSGAARECDNGVPRLSTPGWRWENEPTGGRFYNAVNGTFTVDGYGRFPLHTLKSSYFFCGGPGSCRF